MRIHANLRVPSSVRGAILTACLMALPATAARLTFSPTAPSPGSHDVFHFEGAARDGQNVRDSGSYSDGSANDAFTYVASDRRNQGQSFTTGTHPGGYRVTAVWARHVGYTANTASTSYRQPTGAGFTVRVIDPSRAGTSGFALRSETYTVTGTEPDKFPAGGTSSNNGTGKWLRFEFDTPVPLNAGTQYGFDLTSTTANNHFEWLGSQTDGHAGGGAWQGSTSGITGGPDQAFNPLTGDRVFLVEMEPRSLMITRQPDSTAVVAGADAAFRVEASGLGVLAYQWFRNGTEIPGATSATLTLGNVSATDAADYTVRVTDNAAATAGIEPSVLLSRPVFLLLGDLGTNEFGLTLRLYDIREEMDRLYPLVPGQTPNVDEKRTTIDWPDAAAFGGLAGKFVAEVSADLRVTEPGAYAFRLTSADGSRLWIDDSPVIDHDGEHGPTPMEANATLSAGLHPLRLRFFQNTGDPFLKLEWRPPGAGAFVTVPASAFTTPAGVTRVVAPGKKNLVRPGDGSRPGNGLPLDSVHPSWRVATIHPAGFNPKVGAMTFHPDGRLLVTTFEPNQTHTPDPLPGGDGKIWALANVQSDDPQAVTVTEIASGLSEPLGMKIIGDDLYVTQRLALTRLRDANGDGYYETKETIGSGWTSNNYHHFHFGLIENNGFAYSSLSTTINSAYPGLNGPNPPNRGTLVRTNLATGAVTYLAGGLRTPNGLCFGPEGEIFGTDNQGAWLPASRLNHLREGGFYGHRNNTANGGSPSLFSDRPESPPAVWFPQNEVANSPSQPVMIPHGAFAGDLLVGDITLGGINRVSLEKIHGVWQGGVYRFTQGLEGGVNRLAWGPGGSLYVGCIGASGNWSWQGTRTGLQRLVPKSGAPVTFEIRNVRVTAQGFEIAYTRPVPASFLGNPANFTVKQWRYTPTADYGGPKIDEETLATAQAVPSADRMSVSLGIPGLKRGRVVYLKADPVSDDGSAILSTEAWYTLNEIPQGASAMTLDSDGVLENQPAGTFVGTLRAEHDRPGEPLTFTLPHGLAPGNARFAIEGDTLVTATALDHERQAAWTIRVRVTDSEGVSTEADFTVNVLDQNPEHPPARIQLTNAVLPPDHAAGAFIGRLLVDDPDAGDRQEASASAIPAPAEVDEPFDYSTGADQAGQTGGIGFSGPWQRTGTASTIPAGTLSYVDAMGAKLETRGNRGFCPVSTRYHRPLAHPRGTPGTTTYASFLADPGNNVHFWGVEFWNGTASDANRVLQIGNQNGFGARVRNGTSRFFPVSDSGSHFFVVKIEHLAENDRVSVWLDPLLSSEPTQPDLHFTSAETGGPIAFDRIGFGNFVAAATPAIDELRIGSDWESVTPHGAAFPRFELVSGEGDTGNASIRLDGDHLFTVGTLAAGLHTLRVKATDSAGLSREQALLVWIGSGHLDSNGDGISDGAAVRAGRNPLEASAPDRPDAYFKSAAPAITLAADTDDFTLEASTLPGNLYWLESSSDLIQWSPEPESWSFPSTFSDSLLRWQVHRPEEDRFFWRAASGWPRDSGTDPLADGIAGLTLVGGSAGWSYDAATGILKHASAAPSSWACFDGEYSDFLLSLEYRLSSGGNAGVFLRCAETGNPWETGSEIQLTNEPRLPIHSTGAVYDRIPASPAADARHSIWHRLEALMIGDRLRVAVDGVTTVDLPDVHAAYPSFGWPDSGRIGLQNSHSGTSGTVEYRAIRILRVEP